MQLITRLLPVLFISVSINAQAQVLIDSIPFPGMLNLNFWGIHVTADTIFLGADGPGEIYFSDHDGTILGNIEMDVTYAHGLIKRESSYLIAEDYSTSGALLQEMDLNGQLMNEWEFPPGIVGNSSGIGGLDEAGDGAIWFTVYHPWSETYPYTYAYKWIPGSTTFLDTVPLQGRQPYGITVKGDTLFYVIDNIHDDIERIYAYDLASEEDLYWIDLPDTPIDNDQRPFGLDYHDGLLYLIANRQGGSAFAHQTIFIYSFDNSVGVNEGEMKPEVHIYPNPASDLITIELEAAGARIEIFDPTGKLVHQQRSTGTSQRIAIDQWPAGVYLIKVSEEGTVLINQQITVIR